MKKASLRLVFMGLLFVASISAYLFLNATTNITKIPQQAIYEASDSLESEPYLQLDVEIIKQLLEQGKDHFPIISTSSSSVSDAIE